MHNNTISRNKQPILVPSRFQERRIELTTLAWAGFWTGILLGGITILMR